MYQKGDYVVYGTKGVCLVEDVMAIDWGSDCISSEKLCYKLSPRFVKGSTIYAPVENEKTVIRSVMSGEEAQALLNRAGGLETLWIKDEKEREMSYRRALLSGSSTEWSRIIKTLYLRKKRTAEIRKTYDLHRREISAYCGEHIVRGDVSAPAPDGEGSGGGIFPEGE